MSSFVIEGQKPSTYLDKRGEPIQGFLIQGTLLPWDEPFNLQVATLDQDTIKELLDQLVADREGLDKLSNVPTEG
ncbi:hypothetical protein LCGC14_2120420 [marine sediment metagenome]|uniref:Uncharacterized protein n=1 Tax=marine sediment metagenome TaxID=412755 RepID=A0A0F9E4F9_9ZZZZ